MELIFATPARRCGLCLHDFWGDALRRTGRRNPGNSYQQSALAARCAVWAQTIEGAWWMRRSVNSPEASSDLMGEDLANETTRLLAENDWVTLFLTPASTADLSMSVSLLEACMYLRNQLLRDSGWASMGHSFELRTPLVDARLLTQLRPVLCQLKRFPNKRLLANATSQPLPHHIVQRRKTGFGIPLGRWQNAISAASNNVQDSGAWAKTVAHVYQERNLQSFRSLA